MTRGMNTLASTRRTPVSAATACLAGLALAFAAAASAPASQPPAPTPPAPDEHSARSAAASVPTQRSTPAHYRPDRFAGRAGTYYRLIWGVDSLSVRWGESGEVIRFSYHVLDADKAKMLNDKKLEPSLIDPQAGVRLVVPAMENVGQLRQSAPPESGKAYWMVFSNKGRLVKRGDHVSVVIGTFRADGLVVD
ncbi:MAG TPA: hypothetical protein VF764_08660 [Steroidobacteraceae bacterium]